MEQSKFKYLLSPDNTYILDYGDFVSEISGADIMNRLRREIYLSRLFLNDTDTNTELPRRFEPNTYDAGL